MSKSLLLASAIKKGNHDLARQLTDQYCEGKYQWFKRGVCMMAAVMNDDWETAVAVADTIVDVK